MGTEKRERQKANRAAKLEAEQAAEARKKRNQTIRTVVIATVAIVAVMLVMSLTSCSSDSSDGADEATDTTGETTTADGCTANADLTYDAAPEMTIDPAKSYTAKVETTEGDVVIALDTERTPATVNNFVFLAEEGYYDCTDLFRTEATTGIIQGGSPHTQSNSDQGPGYTIEDEGGPFTSDDYAPGTIAMANTGQPNSASAQFFFLANEGGAYLGDEAQIGPSAGSYAVFGQATEGVDVLERIANLESSPGAGTPSKQVTIEKVTISES